MIRAKMLATRAGHRPAGPTDMAREASYHRLVPDPSITVPKMIAMLKAFQRSRRSNDIVLHLRGLQNFTSWSCAMSRCIKAICELHDLFELALGLGENGMLPRAGLRDALMRLNTETDKAGDLPPPVELHCEGRFRCRLRAEYHYSGGASKTPRLQGERM